MTSGSGCCGRVSRVKRTARHQSPAGGPLGRGITVVGLAGLGGFQLALAAGAPWGRASYGGAHEGALPTRLRVVSGVAAVVYPATAYAIASRRTPVRTRRRVLTTVSAVMALGTVMNGISPSLPERAIWTPVSALLAVSSWRARR